MLRGSKTRVLTRPDPSVGEFLLVIVIIQGHVLLSMFFWTRFDCNDVEGPVFRDLAIGRSVYALLDPVRSLNCSAPPVSGAPAQLPLQDPKAAGREVCCSVASLRTHARTQPSLEVDTGAPSETESTSQKSAFCIYFKAF